MPQSQLAIGAYVAEQGGFVRIRHARGQQSASGIRTDKGVQTVWHVCRAVQAARFFAVQAVRLERRAGQGNWIAPCEQIKHRRVAGDHQCVYMVRGDSGLRTCSSEQCGNSALNLRLKEISLSMHRRINAADHVCCD